MRKKTIISASKKRALKLKVLAKKKEDVRRKLVVTAKKLVVAAKEKESVRRKLLVTAGKLAVTAKEKESVRSKLAVTAKQLATTAKEKEYIRGKLEVTAKQLATIAKEKEGIRRKLAVTAKQLAATAEEKEGVRSKLAVTAKQLAATAEEKEGVRSKLEVTAKQLAATAEEKEDTRSKLAITAKQLAATAKEKEDIRGKLEVTAKNLAMLAKEKESVRNKLVVFAKEKENVRRKLVVTAEKLVVVATEKESVRKKLVVVAKQLAMLAKEKEDIRKNLAVTAKEKESIRRKLVVTAEKLAVTAKERESTRRKLVVTAKDFEQIRAKNEAMLESIGDGLVATDKNERILLVNKAFERILGWKEGEVRGKLMSKVIPMLDESGKEISASERLITKTIKECTTTEEEKKHAVLETKTIAGVYYYVRKDKTKFPVAVTVAPVKLEHKIIGTIEVFRDITKEQQVDKAKTEFVSLASHQLRTPLTAISWYTEMILKGDVGKVVPEQKKYLEEIYKGDQRMIELVNTLLNVSRLELGTFKVEPTPTDIIALAQSVLDEQKPEIKKKKLIIIKKFSKDVPIFSTDSKLLRMVFQNLLANSVGYTPPGGKIELAISLAKEKGEIQIKISDTGYGIPKNQQNQIFTKFFRADNVREKDTDGTGLGLYIVKSIVENSGGRIWFSSPGGSALGGESSENPGTTFYITLPLAGMKKKEGTKELT